MLRNAKAPHGAGLGGFAVEPKLVALVLAPIVGPLIWAGFYWVAKKIHDYAWKRLPDGKLRALLLRNV